MTMTMTTTPTGPLRAWNRFWFRPVSGRPLGALRVLIGLITLAHLGMLAVDLDYWLTDQGLMSGTEAREVAGPYRFSPLQYVQDPASVRAFFAATVVLAALFTAGWRTRVTGVLLYAGMLSIHHRNIASNCGPDNLLMALLFCLALSPCGAAYSLDARRDARRRGGAPAEPLVVPWAQRLIQFQIALIYFNTAVLKCNGSTWLNGTVLHYVLKNPEVIRFDFSWLTRYPTLLNLGSHSALALEFALPACLWYRPTRRWVMAGGLLLHGGIMLLLNVPLFGELMAASYLAFLDPDEFDALARAVNPLRRRPWTRSRPILDDGRADLASPLKGPHAPSTAGTPKWHDGR